MNFKIQPLGNTQIREVSDLIKENLRMFEKYGYSIGEINNLLDYYSKQNISLNNRESNPFYIIINNEEIWGIGRVNDKKIESTYIKIGHQRQGLGTALLSFLEEIIRENGHKQAELLSVLQAVGFYKKLGYRKMGEIRDDMGYAIRMIKKLGGEKNV